MESRRLVLSFICLQLLLALTYGRIIVLNSNPSTYGWREKRQSHPKATLARIPEVAFSDSSSLGIVPELVEYLTPPPPGDSLTAAARQVNRQGQPWDLGYDANDILVPPADQTRQYDTLKVFSLVPSSGPADGIPALDSSELDSSGSGSSEDFASQEFRRDQRAPQSKGPVYTYVKTDKHGHFKWGVRHGN
ncbi:uncharacterized protein [Halyomorpha halys]|uniref:uncharacterized protein n=1 Tax=Halyomorpha halys TaxID=286706 RepID=UPI0006D500F9|nr:uncharacterized protein LOC106691854 [Halyomorpha halys]